MTRKINQENFNIFYGFRCNYSCQGCSTSSDIVKDKSLDPDLQEIIDIIPDIDKLFNINNMLTLIGGEPFLYWDTKILPILKELQKYFPDTRKNIFTNGALLGKNIDKFISATKEVNNVALEITDHLADLKYTTPAGKVWLSGIEKLENHPDIVKISDEHYHVKNNIYANIYIIRSGSNWVQTFNNVDGKIKPWKTGDPQKSMDVGCTGNICSFVRNNKVYKCGLLANLDVALALRGQSDEPEWQPYLNYEPLDIHNHTQEQLDFFENTYGKPISECDMCPAHEQARIIRTYDMIVKG